MWSQQEQENFLKFHHNCSKDNLMFFFPEAMNIFHMHCIRALVLDEDGTGVDTEDFFQTLKDNTVLMVLGKGQKWAPQQVSVFI